MKTIKYLALALLPAFALTACGKEEGIHVSTPKEVVTKYYDEDGSVETKKDIYAYDKNGNVTFNEVFYYNDEAKKFDEYQKNEYAFDKDGNEIQFLQYKYSDSSYKPSYKVLNTYQDKKITKEETFYFDASGNEILVSYKSDFAYDDQNRNTAFNEYSYNEETKVFDKAKTNKFEYKGDIKEFAKLEENDLANPTYSYTKVREFNDKGQIVSEIGATADNTYVEAELFVYNEDGNVQSNQSYFVDYETGAYHLLSVTETNYVNKHYASEQIVTYYNNDGNIKIYRECKYTYDDKMNVLSYTEKEYNPETKKMELTQETTMSY